LSTDAEEIALALCVRCQNMRRAGQLPVEMLLQQWYYGLGRRDSPEEVLHLLQVILTCLGCGETLHPGWAERSPSGGPFAPRRMPDGSIVVSCSVCRRANVLEGRGGQLIAVRLW
jgi:hypothetical protein